MYIDKPPKITLKRESGQYKELEFAMCLCNMRGERGGERRGGGAF